MKNLHEVDAASGIWCVPQKRDRLLWIVVCVSGSRALSVRFRVRILLKNTNPFLGFGIAALEEESLEGRLGSRDRH